MDLYRSLTTRRTKQDASPSSPERLGRAASQRAGRPVHRTQISSPLALLSTSNMMLNNAQHINGTTHVDIRKTSSESSMSGDDSDASTGSVHTRATITDASSIDTPSSPEPEPNHLSCYFKPNVDTRRHGLGRSLSLTMSPTGETPKLPQRVPSHSKRAHENLHRKRSIQRMMSPPATSREVSRSSAEMFSPQLATFVEAPREGPFGEELAQLDEVAEEFGMAMRDAESSEDKLVMRTCGLAQFGASDYLDEIQSLIADTFGVGSTATPWI